MQDLVYEVINNVAVSEQEKYYMLEKYENEYDKLVHRPIIFLYDNTCLLRDVKDIDKESVRETLDKYLNILEPFERVFDLELTKEENMHWNHWPHNDIEQMLINGLSIKYETELLKKILAIETKEDVLNYLKYTYYSEQYNAFYSGLGSYYITKFHVNLPSNLEQFFTIPDNYLEFNFTLDYIRSLTKDQFSFLRCNDFLALFAVRTMQRMLKEDYSENLYEDLRLALLFGNMNLLTTEFKHKDLEKELYKKFLPFTTIYKIDHKRFMHKIVKIAKSKI